MKRSLFVLSLVACSAFAEDPQWKDKAGPEVTITKDLNAPASVFLDRPTAHLLISNIGGGPFDKDNNGSISELRLTGEPIDMKFIEGGKKGVTLHAPGGAAVVNGVLYVCDIDTVRMFDRTTGAPKGDVKMPGMKFAGGLAVGPDGTLYVSDIGIDSKLQPVGSDAIWAIDTAAPKPTVKVLIKSKDLHGPNGLVVIDDAVLYATFGAAEIGSVNLKTRAIGTPTKIPHGRLDGLAAIGDDLFVSSWEGRALYRGKLGGPFVETIGALETPGDFAVDPLRKRIIIPQRTTNTIGFWSRKWEWPTHASQPVKPSGSMTIGVGETKSVTVGCLKRLVMVPQGIVGMKPVANDTVEMTGMREGQSTLVMHKCDGQRVNFAIEVVAAAHK